jgi:hypothetical protein
MALGTVNLNKPMGKYAALEVFLEFSPHIGW